MVSGMDLAGAGINRLVRSLERDGFSVREINASLLSAALRRWVEERGEEGLRILLQCELNQIDEGAYRDDYVAPEARMQDEDEARERRRALTVIEGGGGRVKVWKARTARPASPSFGDFFSEAIIFRKRQKR